MTYRGPGRITALALVGVMGLAACQPVPPTTPLGVGLPTTTVAPPTTVVPPPVDWVLSGGDEFNGTAVDRAKWKPYNNTYGDGNHELACLTPNNVVEGGGALAITAKKEQVTCPGGSVRPYTSGFIGSRDAGQYYPRYARFEIRAKVPHAQGLWPAFWLRHRNGASVAEVDVLEYFHSQRPGKGYATLHLDGRKNLSKGSIGFESPTSVPGWHTWAVEISPDASGVRFDFFMDGAKFLSYVDTQHNWASADPSATWDIAINQAVGGDWVGGPDDTLGYLANLNRCSISGVAPTGCTTAGINRVDWTDPADATYAIDYVRVFTRP